MPCKTYTDEEIAAQKNTELKAAMKEIDRLTRLLCGICNAVDSEVDTINGFPPLTFLFAEVPGLKSWHKEHEIADQKRAREEERRRSQQKAERLARVRKAKRDLRKALREARRDA